MCCVVALTQFPSLSHSCCVSEAAPAFIFIILAPHPQRGPAQHPALTHPVPPVLVGHQHADEDEEHEDPLDGQNAGPQGPVLLDPAGGAVLAAPATRPTGEADGHVRVTRAAAVAAVHGAAICIEHTHTCINTTDTETCDPPTSTHRTSVTYRTSRRPVLSLPLK